MNHYLHRGIYPHPSTDSLYNTWPSDSLFSSPSIFHLAFTLAPLLLLMLQKHNYVSGLHTFMSVLPCLFFLVNSCSNFSPYLDVTFPLLPELILTSFGLIVPVHFLCHLLLCATIISLTRQLSAWHGNGTEFSNLWIQFDQEFQCKKF